MLTISILGQSAYAAEACAQLYVNKKTPPVHEQVKLAIGSDKLTNEVFFW